MFYVDRRRFVQAHARVQGVAVSRAVIEAAVRRRVLTWPSLRAFAGADVRAPVQHSSERRVTGASV